MIVISEHKTEMRRFPGVGLGPLFRGLYRFLVSGSFVVKALDGI